MFGDRAQQHRKVRRRRESAARSALAIVVIAASACHADGATKLAPNAVAQQTPVVVVTPMESASAYTGNDVNGIPRYARVVLSGSDRKLLRDVYGIEDPNRLYVSDSADGSLLKYDTRVKRCARCYVNSYRIGFVSIRRPGEPWDRLERRVVRMTQREFPAGARVATASIAALDPNIVPDVSHMLDDARAAGFRLTVRATYRTPEREAFLMATGGGRTHTLTSLHSYGRAIDIAVDDGNRERARTRTDWIAFRQWVTRYHQQEFDIIGLPDRAWDWPHVEVPSASIGFTSIDEAIARARRCTAVGVSRRVDPTVPTSCDFQPKLPPSDPL